MGRKGCLGYLGCVSVIYVCLGVVTALLWGPYAGRAEFVASFVGLPWSLVCTILTWGTYREACAWLGLLTNCAILGTLWTKLLKAPDRNVKP
jgi:hypothetical protein